eukprot:TRINITY_DN11781_c0_g2_i4.p1 TRINITY_DN11781_c0_g2~~TRINITY_DN11781_c0_g2_i4.p1  ORF type:complete len:769 (+),score=70.82 TRINITY_DN11781_c0_g2_i4:52-2358(+)
MHRGSDLASDGRQQPLQDNALTPHVFLRAPYERPVRTLILLIFVILIALDVLPFYVNLRGNEIWDTILDNAGSYETPIGFTAGLLGCIFLLVAVAGGRAQKQALRSCTFLLHPEYPIHIVNVLLLAGVIPWWFHERSIRMDVDASDLISGWGYISGKACKLMMGLCLLPVARQSLWLNAAAAGYPEGIAFHRVTGWWCVAQVVIHAVCYTMEEAMDAMTEYTTWNQQPGNHTGQEGPTAIDEFDGTKWHAAWRALQVYFLPWATRLSVWTGEPKPNTTAIFIFVGLIGALAAVALAIFSMPRLRRARFDLFYLIHVPAAALFIVMGAVHEFEMQVFVVPGLVTYFLDRTDFLNRTSSSRFHRMFAHVRVMSADWVRLDLVGNLDGLTSEGAYGTQFAYLRVPALGGESHAFSLAARCPSIVIKRVGDWTKQLHQLAMTQATEVLSATASSDGPFHHNGIPMEQISSVTTQLLCEIDGIYGNYSPPWRSFSHVLFVGGGVGVTPWLPAMEEHQELHRLHGSTAQTMRLVWIGRDHTELNAMGPYLPAADTTVFLTRAEDPVSCEALAKLSQGQATAPTQDAVGQKETRPWLFAFIGLASLCLTQMSYYYLSGTQSVYSDYRYEGEPTETQYLLAKVLPVLCSLVAIAVTTIFARWASRCMASLKCPCIASGTGAVTAPQSMLPQLSLQLPKAVPNISVKPGRPDMAALVDAAVAEVKGAPAGEPSITSGLFVCVCGPSTLVQSCKDAVRDAKKCHRDITVDLHAEEPDW